MVFWRVITEERGGYLEASHPGGGQWSCVWRFWVFGWVRRSGEQGSGHSHCAQVEGSGLPHRVRRQTGQTERGRRDHSGNPIHGESRGAGTESQPGGAIRLVGSEEGSADHGPDDDGGLSIFPARRAPSPRNTWMGEQRTGASSRGLLREGESEDHGGVGQVVAQPPGRRCGSEFEETCRTGCLPRWSSRILIRSASVVSQKF